MKSVAHARRGAQEIPAATTSIPPILPVQPAPERSQSAARFSTIPARAYDDLAMTPRLLQVLGLLGCYSNRDGWCYPSARTLAARLRISHPAVLKLIHQLDALGYLTITHRQADDGGKTSNLYRILFDGFLQPERDAQTLVTPEVTRGGGNSSGYQGGNSTRDQGGNLRSNQGGNSTGYQNVPSEPSHRTSPVNDGGARTDDSTDNSTPDAIPDTTPLPYTAWLRSDDGLAYLRTRGVDPHTRKTSQLLTAYRAWYHERGIHV